MAQQRRFRILPLRSPIPLWVSIALGLACVLLCGCLWWYVTAGENEERILSSVKLPSPAETFRSFHSLWFERALTRNIVVTLKRVLLGFALATAVGVPLGVLAGCFRPVAAFLAPLTVFGRNIPLAALIPLTMFLFGLGELRTVMFIFIACVAFVVADAAHAVVDISGRYVDTAYTLGANRWQIIMKVLVPLAMPNVFNALRTLFGLAFGYIMLAEMIQIGESVGGLGQLINISQKRGPREHIYLIILIIPIIALGLDLALRWIQRELFPHRYGGYGILNRALRFGLHAWDDCKNLFRRSGGPDDQTGEPSQPSSA